MKHLYFFLTALMGMVSMTATAHDIEVRNKEGVMIYYKYTNNNYDELAVSYRGTSYDSYSNRYSGDIIIPETVTYNGETLKVTGIGNLAFSGCSGLTSVTIPESVTSIGSGAFLGCSGLTSVTIPESVTSIGIGAFDGCSGLTSVTINCPNVGSWFSGKASIKEITLGESVTSIGSGAFSGCSGLTSVTIPESVASIGSGAFSGCSGLTKMIVKKENQVYDSRNNCNAIIKTANNSLIAGCQSTIIPEGVISIGNYAFSGCSGLTSVTIPEGVTSIGSGAFEGCSGLTSFSIPEGVTSIGNETFYGCIGLTSITIPEGVTSIGDYAFSGCSGLTSVTIGLSSISDNVFSGCNNITALTLNCENIGNLDKLIKTQRSLLKTLIIGDKMKTIGASQFEGFNKLTYVSLGRRVSDIEELAFANCSKIENFYCYASKCPTVARNAFENSYVDFITLHVPENSLEQYQEHKVWGKFMKIVPIEGYIDDNEEKDPLPGDIDHDGHFTVSDITTLINMYLEYEGE